MKKQAIHQFHSGSAYGDAVTNAMLFIQQMLVRFGFDSQIYVERVAPELKTRLTSYRDLRMKDGDVILIHHSMGHDLDDFVTTLAGKKILVYHNITPASFFQDNARFCHYAEKGRKQLKAFRPFMDACVSVSRLNAAELADLGYTDIQVLPLLTAIDALPARPWDTGIIDAAAGRYTLLFVGRITPNKCQEDLIAVARHLRSMLARPFQLVLVGAYTRMDPYYRKLAGLVRSAGLQDQIKFTGKISDAQLYGWYRAADVFVCMSDHEGFGVPLIEAMAFDVPVIAFKSSSVPDTLGGAGILITRKDPVSIAALIAVLARNRAMQRALIDDQRRRAADFSRPCLENQFYRFLTDQGITIPHPPAPAPPLSEEPCLSYQVEGPFETSYSLALVNRETALALDRTDPGSIGLFATEGPGDYTPDPAAVQCFPGLEPLWRKGEKAGRADVVIRNLYPPRVADMDGRINLLSFAWEESMLPAAWVDDFNRHLDGLAVTSAFVKKTLIDNGVALPIAVVGNGTDHMDQQAPEPVDLTVDTGYKFLHVSSGFPRKGVDLLLEAFATTFTNNDDTGLVIKTFPNIHNPIAQQVASLKRSYPDCPPIQVIDQDLASSHMAFLYQACDALVAPSRGEGFGLPMAEAMKYGRPVITTAYGGQSDFCTPETAWLIDFSFEPALTHMHLFDSVWAAPDPVQLGRLMKQVRHGPKAVVQSKVNKAKQCIRRFTWDRCASGIQALVHQVRQTPAPAKQKIRLAWVSSWGTRCGIAAYSRFLLDTLPAGEFEATVLASEKQHTDASPGTLPVRRCWTDRTGTIHDLMAAVDTENPQILVIQFNFVFFTPDHLGHIIEAAKQQNRIVVVFFHATKDVDLPGLEASLASIAGTLARADRLLVHGIEDLNRFKSWGIYHNTSLFPHGVVHRRSKTSPVPSAAFSTVLDRFVFPDRLRSWVQCRNAYTIATYGFLLPHKGLEQLIIAVARLKKRFRRLHLRMVNALYPAPVSDKTLDRCRELIREHRLEKSITLVTDFLSDKDSLSLLECADLIVFPYQDTAESSSAAIRHGLATHRPVACTPLHIFDDVRDIVHVLPGTGPEDLAAGLAGLLEDPALLAGKHQAQARWVAAHDWRRLGKRLGGMFKGLLQHP